MKNELLLGCGHTRTKKMGWPARDWLKECPNYENLYTLDNNPDCKPDLLCDLSTGYMTLNGNIWYCDDYTGRGYAAIERFDNAAKPKLLKENFFHEIHAYEVLEHLGRQGDALSFFNTFFNLHRLLVDGGMVFATCPSRFSGWLWGDPGHTRAIIPESLSFLDQTVYEECGRTTRSDYRSIWKGDFKCLLSSDADKSTHVFILQAVKPARFVQTHGEKQGLI